ncbi:hypothetical protein VaNZ11_012874 [Volvox africanus]|uniref:EF-1-gamma C-terminal domain-containing protein n=1 Tax=Volvox africanus TaxID=51714 RepID=A0ABQ5SG81_9CHLO|nr:hypothetical protein VaNZ11_012874 [Volvox africanus]
MGCGASVHAQGTLPLPSESEREAVQTQTKNSTPAPLANDIQGAQDPDVKSDVDKDGAAQLTAGLPTPAAGAEPDAEQQSQKETCTSATTTTPTEPGITNVQDQDAFSPVVPCSASDVPSLGTGTEEGLVDNPRSPSSPRLSPAPQSAQRVRTAPGGGGGVQEATRLVLGSSTASSAMDLERPTPCFTPGMSSGVFDPAVTPSSATATVMLLPEAPPGAAPRFRYTDASDLSISSHSFDLDGLGGDDSDDDEVATLFTLQSWKRYYGYNKHKHNDLVTYFWRRFPPNDISCFCISYRNQELLLTPYMAENCIHGYCARLEDLGLASEVFLQMYALHDRACDQYRIVGLMLVAGQSLPAALSSLSAFDGFEYHKTETSRVLVKQFVSALLVGRSPLHSLTLISGREVL